MTINEIMNKLVNYKAGTFTRIEWTRCITLKDGSKVYKNSKVVGRLNINYGNLASVKARQVEVADTSREVIPTEWLIKNVVKVTSTGKNVMMIYTTKNKKCRTKTTWFDELGNKINKSSIESLLYAKDNKSGSFESTDLFNVNINDLVSIGQ